MKNNLTNENVVDIRKDRMKVALGPEKQVEVLSEKLVERILFYIHNEEKVNLRDSMIILLLMYTGVRISELCSIGISNIDFLINHLKIHGKGGKL